MGVYLRLLELKSGATALRVALQCSFVWAVSRLLPPRNCKYEM